MSCYIQATFHGLTPISHLLKQNFESSDRTRLTAFKSSTRTIQTACRSEHSPWQTRAQARVEDHNKHISVDKSTRGASISGLNHTEMADPVSFSSLSHTQITDPVSTLSIVLALVLGGTLLLWVQELYSRYSYGASKSGAPLPKGSFGWPIIGDSLLFAQDPLAYSHSRVNRYGRIFKASLFLRRTIVGASPEFFKFVTSNNKIFRHTFPASIEKIVGPKAFMFRDGVPHKSVKKLVMKSIFPEALRTQVSVFETMILEHLASLERSGTVVGLDAVQKITWDTSNWVLFGDKDDTSTPEGRQNFENFKTIVKAASSLPFNLPGTAYSKGMKARAALRAHFNNLIKQGQKSTQGVFFGALLAARDDPEAREELKDLDDDTLGDNIFLLNFAAYDTTSTTLIWTLKFLVDYPDVFRRIQAEQQEILKSKDLSVQGPRLTWEDTRNMVYTHKFFQEVQRTISIAPISFAEATEEVEFEGYRIPKGWNVATLAKFIHSDPVNYPDLSFNPDRFDVTPKPYTYVPFSAGAHMCPGIEMAKLISFIFIHHLTTTYRHERVGPDLGMEWDGAFPKPRGGYSIKFSRRH